MNTKQKPYTDINIPPYLQALPETLLPYALLMRLDRPIGTWLLFLPALASILLASNGIAGVGFSGLYIILLFAIGSVVMRGAGCIINDIWDRDIDKQVERTAQRPIASGAISVRKAILFLGGLLFIGLAILMQFSLLAILLGILSLIFVVIYPYMKRITWWPQAFLGLTFNFGALIGWAAVSGGFSMAALMIYVGGFFWTIGYDTIYAAQDVEDDELIGVRSTVRLFGADSKKLVKYCYILTGVFWGIALWAASSAAAIILVALPAAHLFWQYKIWKWDDRGGSLRLFKANRNAGLLFCLACAGAAFLA
jgi:4-hydroxybenzoate polyprenyltransferase